MLLQHLSTNHIVFAVFAFLEDPDTRDPDEIYLESCGISAIGEEMKVFRGKDMCEYVVVKHLSSIISTQLLRSIDRS